MLSYFADYFRYYAPAPADETADALTLELQRVAAQQALPTDAERIALTGVISLWRISREPEIYWLHVDDATFVVEPAARKVTGFIGDEALAWPPILTNTYSLFALLLLLRWQGVYHLHAAAAIAPDGRLFWLVGESGGGKTTLVTALGLAGWRPLADDSLLWRVESQNASASLVWQSLQKAFHLGTQALTHWQARLVGLQTQPRYLERRSAAALEFFGSQTQAAASYSVVDVILMPEVVVADSTEILPAAPHATFLKLAEQSVYFPMWREHTKQQFNGLSQAVANAKSFRVMSGADVWQSPERVADKILKALA